ncbi:MAG TPA: SRPBCC family protein [Nocardioidaceae bacterium]|nr:SRPBCC family protein [Nocardioidaceae bacterium]
MELEHRFTVPTPVADTWDAFNDLERIAPCFPGASLSSVEGDDFAGSVKVKLGPVSLLYNGSGRFVERDVDAHQAVIEAKGKDKRGNGTASATITAKLSPDGEQTLVEVTTDLAITGKPAQFGRGVIQDVSDKLLGQFVSCLEQNLGGTAPEPEAPLAAETDQPEAPPVQSEPPRMQASQSDSGAELNLLTTVGPALVKRYAVPVLGLLILFLLLRKLLRR